MQKALQSILGIIEQGSKLGFVYFLLRWKGFLLTLKMLLSNVRIQFENDLLALHMLRFAMHSKPTRACFVYIRCESVSVHLCDVLLRTFKYLLERTTTL